MEISPFIVFHEIYTKLNDDLKNYNTFSPGSAINNLNNISGLDNDHFNQLYQKISFFQKTNQSPLSEYFYFILIDTKKCSISQCSKYYYADIRYSCYLEFDASLSGKISDIIRSYFQINSKNSEFNTCIHCLYNAKGIKNLSFLSRPKYLLIHFKGDVIKNKILDDKLDFYNECLDRQLHQIDQHILVYYHKHLL